MKKNIVKNLELNKSYLRFSSLKLYSIKILRLYEKSIRKGYLTLDDIKLEYYSINRNLLIKLIKDWINLGILELILETNTPFKYEFTQKYQESIKIYNLIKIKRLKINEKKG